LGTVNLLRLKAPKLRSKREDQIRSISQGATIIREVKGFTRTRERKVLENAPG